MHEELILRIKEGDQRAFAELYDAYADYALRVAAVITKSKAHASDAVQETFIRVYYNIHAFEMGKPFKPWFYRILLNECNRIMKGSSKTVYMDDYLEVEAAYSKRDEYRFEEYGELYAAIRNLKDINRIPIVLKYLNGFTENEIAQILGINVNTVKSRLLKGRHKLKKILQKHEKGRVHDGEENRG